MSSRLDEMKRLAGISEAGGRGVVDPFDVDDGTIDWNQLGKNLDEFRDYIDDMRKLAKSRDEEFLETLSDAAPLLYSFARMEKDSDKLGRR